jgi:hypothetical protein
MGHHNLVRLTSFGRKSKASPWTLKRLVDLLLILCAWLKMSLTWLFKRMDSICLLGLPPPRSMLFPQLKSPLLPDQILHHSSKGQHNRPDRQGLLVGPVEVIRGSPPPSSVKNPPLPSRKCLGYYLACVTLTMLLRHDLTRIWRRWRKLFTQTRLLPL